MKFFVKVNVVLFFAVSIPIAGMGQERAEAKYICQLYDGRLNNQETPLHLKVRSNANYFTCMVNPDSLSIFDQTDYLISNIPNIQKEKDWRLSGREKHKWLLLEMRDTAYAVLIVPVTSPEKNPDRFHFYTYEWRNHMHDREYRDE